MSTKAAESGQEGLMRRLSAVERAIRKGSSDSIFLIISWILSHDASLSVAETRFFVLFIAVGVMIDGVKVAAVFE